jgi:hypothetical protein
MDQIQQESAGKSTKNATQAKRRNSRKKRHHKITSTRFMMRGSH